MSENIRKIMMMGGAVLLAVTAVMSIVYRDRDFPVVSGWIWKAERQRKDINKKIDVQEKIIEGHMTADQELRQLKAVSFKKNDAVTEIMRSRIEQVFNVSGAKIMTIGSPRKLKGVDGIDLYEINLTAQIKTNELELIAAEFSKPPRLLWRAVNFRPNNMLKPEYLNANLTISAICFHAEEPEETTP